MTQLELFEYTFYCNCGTSSKTIQWPVNMSCDWLPILMPITCITENTAAVILVSWKLNTFRLLWPQWNYHYRNSGWIEWFWDGNEIRKKILEEIENTIRTYDYIIVFSNQSICWLMQHLSKLFAEPHLNTKSSHWRLTIQF